MEGRRRDQGQDEKRKDGNRIKGILWIGETYKDVESKLRKERWKDAKDKLKKRRDSIKK